MKFTNLLSNRLLILAAFLFASIGATTANAQNPCPKWGGFEEFGECKVLVETNSSDGDVGFHFLVDGDNLIRTSLFNPHWRKIWSYYVRRELREQTLTETFNESAEPLCFDPLLDDDIENDDEDYRTLTEFTDLWKDGIYHFVGISSDYEWAVGHTELTFNLPAAPQEVDFELEKEEDDDVEGEISWIMGDDLGMCTEFEDAPANVRIVTLTGSGEEEDERIVAWEIVLEAEFEDDDPNAQKGLKFAIRVGADELECEMDDGECVYEQEVPDDFLEALPEDTELKVEIGAITATGNATFTEEDEFCSTYEGCDD